MALAIASIMCMPIVVCMSIGERSYGPSNYVTATATVYGGAPAYRLDASYESLLAIVDSLDDRVTEHNMTPFSDGGCVIWPVYQTTSFWDLSDMIRRASDAVGVDVVFQPGIRAAV